jgi:aconitate hydratase
LQFLDGQDPESIGLTARESFSIDGIARDLSVGKRLTVRATTEDGTSRAFDVVTRIDTAVELDYYRHGGILQYVLRQLVHGTAEPATP